MLNQTVKFLFFVWVIFFYNLTLSKAQAPVISSFSPLSAKPGDALVINGSGFGALSSENIVYFGPTRAFVAAASASSLTVTVPIGATFGSIKVLNTSNGLSCASVFDFNPIFAPAKSNITTNDFMGNQEFSTGTNPFAVCSGDFDLDGKPDLAVINQGSENVSVLRNTSSSGSINASSFATAVNFVAGTNPRSIATGDLDGDGKLDLVVVNYSANTLSIYRNTSSVGSITSSSFAAKVDIATGTNPRTLAIGDLDGDGKPEIAVVNFNSTNVSVYRNISTVGSLTASSFAARVNYTTGSAPRSVAIGDVDGDSKPELVVANYFPNTVSVFKNTSVTGAIDASSFAAKVDFSTGPFPYVVAMGDLDLDGKKDLAITSYTTAVVSVLKNTATVGTINSSSFAPRVDFATGTNPQTVAIGDLDADGRPDLAIANYGSATTSVLRNLSSTGVISSSSFAAKVDFGIGLNPYSMVIGDLDGDAKMDLAIANNGSASVSVLRNADLPVISGFTPASGCANQTSITITGSSFVGVSAVTVGGVPVSSFTVNSSTEIVAVLGSGTTGLVQVTTGVGSVLSASSCTVEQPITWYLDADSDGWSVSTQSACYSPGAGWVNSSSGGGDCNDNNAAIYPQATEYCANSVDDNCNGTIDENCPAVLLPGDLITNPIQLSNLPYYGVGNQGSIAVNLLAATNSIESSGPGNDIWFRFVANSNAVRIAMIGALGVDDDNEILLYNSTNTSNTVLSPIASENDVNLSNAASISPMPDAGSETLLFQSLIINQTYLVCIRNIASSTLGNVTLSISFLRPSTPDIMPFTNYTGVYTSICSNFKATYRALANGYIVKRWSSLADAQSAVLSSNLGLAVPQWSYSIPPTSNGVGYTICPLSKIIPVNFTSSPISYYVTVDAIYNLKDAAGNSTVITAFGNVLSSPPSMTFQGIVLNPESTSLVVRSSDACPAYKDATSYVITNRSVCGAISYQWKFKLNQPSTGLSIPVFAQGAQGSRILPLSAIAATSGQRYDVWVRTLNLDGISYSTGTAVGNLAQINTWFPSSGSCSDGSNSYCGNASCVRTMGSAGMVVEVAEEGYSIPSNFEIFPNPVRGGSFNLRLAGMMGEIKIELIDFAGSVVSQEVVFSLGDINKSWTLSKSLASGIYQVRVSNGTDQRAMRLVVID